MFNMPVMRTVWSRELENGAGKGLARAKPFPIPFLIVVHSTHIYLPMKMKQTECSETSAYKLQTPGNYPKESIQKINSYCYFFYFT